MKYTILLTFLLVGSLAKGQGSTHAIGKCDDCPVFSSNGLILDHKGRILYPDRDLRDTILSLEQRVELLKRQEEQDSKKQIKKVVPESNFIRDFLSLYDEYSKECFNDSTKVCYGMRISGDGKSIGDVYHWDHKIPDLPGFAEYLRKKKQ
jgi:hypothetical protein